MTDRDRNDCDVEVFNKFSLFSNMLLMAMGWDREDTWDLWDAFIDRHKDRLSGLGKALLYDRTALLVAKESEEDSVGLLPFLEDDEDPVWGLDIDSIVIEGFLTTAFFHTKLPSGVLRKCLEFIVGKKGFEHLNVVQREMVWPLTANGIRRSRKHG